MVTAKEVIIDYHLLDFVFLGLLCLIWGFLQNANPNRFFVPKRDPRCSYPHYDSGLSEAKNLVVVVALPIILYTIMYVILKVEGVLQGMIPFDYLSVVIGHCGCVIIGNILANVLKLQIGRPRPDFFAVLGLNANSETPIPDDMSVKNYIECFKSFPSGHTVSASAGAMFLVLFLQHAIESDQFTVYFLKVLPFAYTFYIGGMRITEHRHHFEDVLGGLIIGLLFPIVFFAGQQRVLFPQAVKP
jgi:membrane-associated phospholipid phosphatase